MPKNGKNKYRGIADSRVGNKALSDWGSRLFSALDLAAALTWRAFVNGQDVNDGYHMALLLGCTDELVWGWGVVGLEYIYPGFRANRRLLPAA